MTINVQPGGYLTLTTMFNLPEGGHISLQELLSQDGYPLLIGNDLQPVTVLDIENQGENLIRMVRTESGAGVQATDGHVVLKAFKVENGYELKKVAISDLVEGDLLVVNPRINDQNGVTMDLSPVDSISLVGLESVYSIAVDNDENGVVANDIVNFPKKG